MHRTVALLAAITIAASPVVSFAHGGGLDSRGCHTDNSTGVYHCHGTNSGSGGGQLDIGTSFIIAGVILAAIGATVGFVYLAQLEREQNRPRT